MNKTGASPRVVLAPEVLASPEKLLEGKIHGPILTYEMKIVWTRVQEALLTKLSR